MNSPIAWLAAFVSLAVSGLLLVLPVTKGFLVLFGAALALLIMSRPWLGVYGFAFFASLVPYSTVTLGIRITVSETFLLLTWLALVWHLLSGRLTWTWTTLDFWLLSLLGFSLVPFVVGQMVVDSDSSGLVGWIRWILNLSSFFLVSRLITDKSRIHGLVASFLLGSVLMVLVSLLYFVRDFDARSLVDFLELARYGNPDAYIDIFSSFNQRLGSPWVHPNLLGGFLAAMVLVVYGRWLEVRGEKQGYLLLAAALVLSLGLVMSISRGAILSIFVVLLWLTYHRVPWSRLILAAFGLLAVVLVLFYAPVQDRILASLANLSDSDSLRIEEYRHFPAAVRQFPLGIGFKTDPPPPGTDLLGISNLLLNYVYKVSVVGLALFLGALICWWRSVAPRRYQPAGEGYYLHVGLVGAVLAALCTGLVDHYYSFTNVLTAIFWVLIGLSCRTGTSLVARTI